MVANVKAAAATSWGPWACGPGADDALCGLADLVRHVQGRDGSLWRDAIDLVLSELTRSTDVDLFERAMRDAYAARIDDGRQWRKAVAARPAGVGVKIDRIGRALLDGHRALQFVPRPAVKPVEGLQGRSGALQLARESWAEGRCRMPDALEWPWPSRLAIRASQAAALFGLGEEPSQAPALPDAFGPHDALRWGVARTWEAKPRELRRFADAVVAAMRPGAATASGLPLRDAVKWLCQGLAASAAPDWFVLDVAMRPRPVADSDVWQEGQPSGAEELQSAGYELQGGQWVERAATSAGFKHWDGQRRIPLQELAARGGMHLVGEPGAGGERSFWEREPAVLLDLVALSKIPGVRDLRGAAGLAEYLAGTWCESLASVADVDSGPVASLALPVAALAALPWRPAAPQPRTDAGTTSPLRLAHQRPSAEAIPAMDSGKRPGEHWTAAHRAKLMQQHQSLTNGPSRLKVEAADRELAVIWHVSESNIKQQRLKGKREAEGLPKGRAVSR